MNFKRKLFNITIWWSIIGAAIWIGGTVYMMLVINPQWSSDPPRSVNHFFIQTTFNKYIWNFFGPPFMLLRSVVPQLLSLLLSWKSKIHRHYLLITFSCTLTTIIYTLFYIYPINDVLMFQAGGQNPPVVVQNMVMSWLFADRIRFIINLVGFFYLLKTFRLPVSK